MKRVYICSKLDRETVEHTTTVLEKLVPNDDSIHVLRPTPDQPEKFTQDCIRSDVWMIDNCDELWVVGKWGRDCMWEIGYAMARQIPVVMYIDETNKALFEDMHMYLIGHDTGLLTVKEL